MVGPRCARGSLVIRHIGNDCRWYDEGVYRQNRHSQVVQDWTVALHEEEHSMV